jgi:hypothetical protein
MVTVWKRPRVSSGAVKSAPSHLRGFQKCKAGGRARLRGAIVAAAQGDAAATPSKYKKPP